MSKKAKEVTAGDRLNVRSKGYKTVSKVYIDNRKEYAHYHLTVIITFDNGEMDSYNENELLEVAV